MVNCQRLRRSPLVFLAGFQGRLDSKVEQVHMGGNSLEQVGGGGLRTEGRKRIEEEDRGSRSVEEEDEEGYR